MVTERLDHPSLLCKNWRLNLMITAINMAVKKENTITKKKTLTLEQQLYM